MFNASGLCPLAAFAGAGAYQLALELRKPGKYGEHEASVGGGNCL